jgi:hypothetical protein
MNFPAFSYFAFHIFFHGVNPYETAVDPMKYAMQKA